MTFSQDFAQSRGRPILVDGVEVVPMMVRRVRPGSRVRVIWRHAILRPVQGIRLKVAGGSLLIEGTELPDVVLWRDTAPAESMFVVGAKKPTELRIWNCWRDDSGVMQAWVGNAAMRVDESAPNRVSIACNVREQISFTDLIFDVYFEE